VRVVELVASFEKRVSDGNYGGEQASVQLRASVESDDHLETCLDILQNAARERVHADLRHSLSTFVRLAAGPEKPEEPEPTPFDDIELEVASATEGEG
jgi:hypothetical protein